MTTLPKHITTYHLSLSDSFRQFARKKIVPETRFSASARLALPGGDVHGQAVDSNLYDLIGKLVARLGRLLRKRKTRLTKTFERPDRTEDRTETFPERRVRRSKSAGSHLGGNRRIDNE